MKCPICKSENVSTGRNGFNKCNDFCGYAWQEKELSTAEKLLWLVENGFTIYSESIGASHGCLLDSTKLISVFYGKDEDCKTLKEAVDKAYKKAKESK